MGIRDIPVDLQKEQEEMVEIEVIWVALVILVAPVPALL